MKIINKPRQMGKTTNLIKLCASVNGLLIVPNLSQKNIVIKMAHNLGLNPIILSVHEIDKYPAYNPKFVFIDNADEILQHLIGGYHISAISITKKAKL
jgi:hypothetical protein